MDNNKPAYLYLIEGFTALEEQRKNMEQQQEPQSTIIDNTKPNRPPLDLFREYYEKAQK
ncbi:hypothetical protein [Desulfosporosinus sp. Sb-LF]|uniref:hypothetical protein n=1 Tax=Desulfosporosinus sp. Sb-LF TaxID=2560027 RepID=UPI0013053D39|nr:hypothetical protein [Desulfosporosinus sp. Sb-LF]